MAYLGDIVMTRPMAELIWTRYVIPEALIGEIVGHYATYGGYIFVG